MSDSNIDAIRENVLAEMDASARRVRLLLLGAAMGEAALIALALVITDWKDPVQRLVFVMGFGTYTMLVVGLVTLGAYVSRSLSRIVTALSVGD